MSELNKQTEKPDLASASVSSIARRRMILASLGKGASVAAAVAVPMNTLAAIGTPSVTGPPPDGKRCTISGTMSMPHSGETVQAICAGGSPSYYSNIDNWPNAPSGNNSIYGGSGSFNKNTKFNVLFGSGSDGQLIDILLAGASAEASWITAVLNGTPGSYGANHNFPYKAAEVIGFYQGTSASSALAFFQGYMQTYGG